MNRAKIKLLLITTLIVTIAVMFFSHNSYAESDSEKLKTAFEKALAGKLDESEFKNILDQIEKLQTIKESETDLMLNPDLFLNDNFTAILKILQSYIKERENGKRSFSPQKSQTQTQTQSESASKVLLPVVENLTSVLSQTSLSNINSTNFGTCLPQPLLKKEASSPLLGELPSNDFFEVTEDLKNAYNKFEKSTPSNVLMNNFSFNHLGKVVDFMSKNPPTTVNSQKANVMVWEKKKNKL
ncbi:MAG: hypothetical protein HQK49_06605 [Oligoflexia bacterium]|nr:hypothetical protein [Oligoflexia bacterium]